MVKLDCVRDKVNIHYDQLANNSLEHVILGEMMMPVYNIITDCVRIPVDFSLYEKLDQ